VVKLVEIGVAADLVAQACRGDEHAQSEIYTAFAPATLGLIRRVVGGGAQAEDLFQDTMMTFFERLQTYRAEAPLGAWLRQIALSKCFMYLRSPWHRARLQLGGVSEEAVVWLFEVEGYSHDEIGHAFGRSASFSKSQLARAHRRLRAWFEPAVETPACTSI
jgi:RNA polymerase sigma-70 factor (ECF subfamily)